MRVGRRVLVARRRRLVDELLECWSRPSGVVTLPVVVVLCRIWFEQAGDERIGGRGLAVLRREREQVHRAQLLDAADRDGVGEDAVLRVRVQDRARPGRLARLVLVLHVEEEERLVPAVEEPRDDDRPADAAAVLVCIVTSFFVEPVDLVEVVVRVQPRVAERSGRCCC